MTKNFFRSVYQEKKSIVGPVCVYSGRFQPFGPHHFSAYDHLCRKFGPDSVFVATSDNTNDPNNPLSFEEKRRVMEKYGVRNICQVSSPYRPIELTRNLSDNTGLIIAVGDKDSDRLVRSSDGYYQKYDPNIPMNGYRRNGYVYLIPTISIRWRGQVVNGTLLRSILADLPKLEFEELMGWWDGEIQNLFRDKFTMIQNATPTGIFEEILSDQTSKHLKQPWEYLDLSYNEMVQLISDSLIGKLESVTEKIDGQNLLVTIKDSEILFARSKSEILNPLNTVQFQLKFKDKIDSVKLIFMTATGDLHNCFRGCTLSEINEFFRNGKRFLNMEIYNPKNINVINYGNDPLIILHGLIEFDDTGNEISRNESLAWKLYERMKGQSKMYTILPPRKLVLKSVYNASKKIQEFESELNSIWKKNGLGDFDTLQSFLDIKRKNEIQKIPKEEFIRQTLYPFEILFSKVGFTVLSDVEHILCKSPYSAISDIRKRIAKDSTIIHSAMDPKKIKKLQTELSKLNAIGGSDTILGIEGIVFVFNGRLMKMTGSFRFINQILGINRYSR